MAIYNHCIEDRQKNLVFMSEMPEKCRLVTIKPLSHIAYVIARPTEQSQKRLQNLPSQFTEANKVLFSEITYDLAESKDNGTLQSKLGLIEFVKQISSVRQVTAAELDLVLAILNEGQRQIPEAIKLVKKGLYRLTYIY